MLTVEKLQKSFTIHHLGKKVEAFDQVSFHVPQGDFLGIVGKSGSGKSTILKSIYRTYLPQKGSVWYESKKYGTIDLIAASDRQMLHLRKEELGYVSQFLKTMPRTTAYEYVLQMVLAQQTNSHKEAEAKTAKILKEFDLDESIWENYPSTFSGGEQMRLNLAGAMAKEPRLLLLDEPTASLDEASKEKVRKAIEKLKANGTTMVGIFHDLKFMDGLCDQVLEMKEGCLTSENQSRSACAQ